KQLCFNPVREHPAGSRHHSTTHQPAPIRRFNRTIRRHGLAPRDRAPYAAPAPSIPQEPERSIMSTPAETSIIHRGEATSAEWKAFITAKHSGEVVEIDRAMFDYWLNVLPVKG